MPTDKIAVTHGTPQNVRNHLRYLAKHENLHPVFGGDWFARKAENFARFFGTSIFLMAQTIAVTIWIVLNTTGLTAFDIYPFILLNLAFSLQAAYAAPLILLAQTRQADRDKAHAEADAQHREDLAKASEERQEMAYAQSLKIIQLIEQNTELTMAVKDLSQRVETLTSDLHKKLTKLFDP